MIRDTRLVQTAVIGDEQSDVPVVLPPEAIELDVFRSTHVRDTFWCGLLLGGCGAQLATKLYIDRQCHFQHFPLPNGAPNNCRRPAVGESSADHLYVKSAMSRSLLEHGRAARFAFPPPIGSLVDVDLEDGVSLRIHMDGSVPPERAEQRAVFLGPGVVPALGWLAGCPYVYRVRCDTDGATRRVWIGTQSLAHPTEWVSLSECAWTDDGLLTPAASRILRARDAAPSESPPRRSTLPENVVTFVRGLEAAQRTGTVEHVRRLCNGSSSFLQSLDPAVRAQAENALTEARTWLTTHEDYQSRLFAELDQAVRERRAWDVRSRLQQAAALTRRGASTSEQRVLAAARAYLRGQDYAEETPSQAAWRRQAHYKFVQPAPKKPPVAKKPSVPSSKAKQRQTAAADMRRLLKRLRRDERHLSARELREMVGRLSRAAEEAGDAIGPKDRGSVAEWARKTKGSARPISAKTLPRGSTRPSKERDRSSSQLDPLASAVKTILQKAASTGSTLTWSQLREQLPAGLPPLERNQHTAVLIRVDRSRGHDAPLLSALVTAADHDMHPTYPRIAEALGRPPARGNLEAVAQWAMEVSRIQRKRTH